MDFEQIQIDNAMQVALINFFSMSKEREIIELKNLILTTRNIWRFLMLLYLRPRYSIEN